MHTLQRLAVFFIAAGVPLCSLAEDRAGDRANQRSDVPEVFPTATRDNKIWRQDDHIHTTPDEAEQRFDALDADDDRRLQWGEVQVVDMEKEVFKVLDTDGSGSLDSDEYIAISPRPENDHPAEAMPES